MSEDHKSSDAEMAHPHAAPAYTRHDNSLKEFHDDLTKGGVPWATLTLIADAQISKQIPTYVGSNPVTGRVTLDLPKPDSIVGLEIEIKGRIFLPQLNIQISREESFFLKLTKRLWSKEDGPPPRQGGSSEPSESASEAHHSSSHHHHHDDDGKLAGRYSWDFSIPLPKTATLPYFESHPFPLPGSMSAAPLRVSIGYSVNMTIFRSGMFKSNESLTGMTFAYIPVIVAPPFPLSRWECYQSGVPPLDAADDPEGWEALKPFEVKGKAFNDRHVTVKCSLYVAKPLVYVRGSFIPLYLELESEDPQVLDVVGKPEAFTLVLCRYLKDRNMPDANTHGNWTDKITYQADDIEKAAWWVTPGQQAEGLKKVALHGELHLGGEFPASLTMGRFTVQYTLAAFPFEITGFKSEVKHSEVLLEHPITIVTAFADHVRPVSQAPPGTKLRHTPTGRLWAAIRD